LLSGADREPAEVEKHVSALAAGIGPEDVSAAEVHDATAMGEIVQVENLGFCALGDGGPISARGETQIGGRIPVNPSGALSRKDIRWVNRVWSISRT
jgi:acetyl-CoA acetyltransferase